MKWITTVAVATVFVDLYGCSKNSGGQPGERTLKIVALEKGTRKAIAGATIGLLRCSRYDYQSGMFQVVKSESGVPFVPIKNDTLGLTISY